VFSYQKLDFDSVFRVTLVFVGPSLECSLFAQTLRVPVAF